MSFAVSRLMESGGGEVTVLADLLDGRMVDGRRGNSLMTPCIIDVMRVGFAAAVRSKEVSTGRGST